MPSLFRWLATVVLLSALVPPAGAAMVLTLNDPNPTIVLPSSSFDYVFSGSFELDPGYSLAGIFVSWAYQDGFAAPLETTPLVPSPSSSPKGEMITTARSRAPRIPMAIRTPRAVLSRAAEESRIRSKGPCSFNAVRPRRLPRLPFRHAVPVTRRGRAG